MEYKLAKIKVKDDQLETVRKYQTYKNNNLAESLKHLGDEGVSIESWYLDKQSDGYWIYAFMRIKNLEKAKQVANASTQQYHLLHQEFKKAALDGTTHGFLEELWVLDILPDSD